MDDDKLKMPISELELGMRTWNMLDEEGIHTVEELLWYTADDLLEIPNFGGRTLAEVYEALGRIGFHRKAMRP